MRRAVIFVDGANFYHQLRRLHIAIEDVKNWDSFFGNLIEEYRLVRVYWYQIARVQDQSITVESLKRYLDQKRMTLQQLGQHWSNKDRKSVTFAKEGDAVTRIRQWLDQKMNQVASQHRQFDRILDTCKRLEFKRVGILKCDPYVGESIGSKGDDVAMAVDLVSLAPYYDTALIVSGDYDFAPAIQRVKDMLKEVISIQFANSKGTIGVSQSFKRLTDDIRVLTKEEMRKFL